MVYIAIAIGSKKNDSLFNKVKKKFLQLHLSTYPDPNL